STYTLSLHDALPILLPQDPHPRGGRTHPMRRAHPNPEGEEEEPLHILPPERVHLLRDRQAPRPLPAGDGPGQGLRRRLERPRPDEAVRFGPSRFFPSHLFLFPGRARAPEPGPTIVIIYRTGEPRRRVS